MATIAVHAKQTGQVQIKSRQTAPRHERREARVLDMLVDRKWTPRLPMSCYAIEHPEGVIVVDTGQDSRTARIRELCARRRVLDDRGVVSTLSTTLTPQRST